MASWLFIPGNKSKMLEKMRVLESDYFIIDLEDAVPDQEKAQARIYVNEFLKAPVSGKKIYIRINSYESNEYEEDLKAIPAGTVQGIILSKCESREEVAAISGITELAITPLIESLKGFRNLEEILAQPQVERAAFGSVDLSNDLKLRAGDRHHNPLLNNMRLQISLLSKLAGKKDPIDAPYIQIDDLENLKAECEYARKAGYSGKLAIHPKQTETIRAIFGYSEEELQLAKEIVQRYEESDVKTFSHRDMMVDKPVYLAMKDILGEVE